MSNLRVFGIVAVSVVLTVVACSALTHAAHADTPRTMVCRDIPTKYVPNTMEAQAKALPEGVAWANEQLAAGKTSFGVMPLPGVQGPFDVYCAW